MISIMLKNMIRDDFPRWRGLGGGIFLQYFPPLTLPPRGDSAPLQSIVG